MTDYEKKTVEKVVMLMRSSKKATAARNERQAIREMLDQAKKKKGPEQMTIFGNNGKPGSANGTSKP